MNYVAFALDVYGTGVRAANDTQAEAFMDALLDDPAELRKRIMGGWDQLKTFNADDSIMMNTSALTANGYCFVSRCPASCTAPLPINLPMSIPH